MAKLLTNREAISFLEDAEKNCQIHFLKEGKEKEDLIASAKKRGIIVQDSRDLGIVKTIYAFGNKANENGAYLPRKEFQKKLPGLVGKLMDVGHNRQFIVGYYIDYKYIVKEDKAIAYAIFFKSAFPELWDKAKEFQKEGKLSSSFEIWSPEDKTKYRADGSYELHDMEMAGGALIFEDEENKPAFPDAKVLNIAKKCIGNKQLHMASKYNKGTLLTADSKEELPRKYYKDESIVCANCKQEILIEGATFVRNMIKCPSCSVLVNQKGEVEFPNQDINFTLSCSNCRSRKWLVRKRGKNKILVECLECSTGYKLEFSSEKNKSYAENYLNIVGENLGSCPQCGYSYKTVGFSKTPTSSKITCDRCGLEFSSNPVQSSGKLVIKKMIEIATEAKDKLLESSDKGGSNMQIPKDVEDRVKKAEKEDKTAAEEALEEAKKESLEAEKTEDEKVEAKTEEAETKGVEDVTSESEDVVEASEEDTEKTEMYPSTKYLRMLVEARKDLKKVKATLRKSAKRTVSSKKLLAETKTNLEEASSKRERNAEGVRKVVKRLMAALEKNTELEKSMEDLKETYKEEAREVIKRRASLGSFADDMSDDDLLNDDKFETAQIKKENELLKANLETADEKVATKDSLKEDSYYEGRRKAIDKEAAKYFEAPESE